MADLTHTELVDRVARALCKASGDVDFDVSSPERQETFTRMAIAARDVIYDALAEPTEVMIRAPFPDAPGEFLTRDDVRDCFRAMLLASPLFDDSCGNTGNIIFESNAGSGLSHHARAMRWAEEANDADT